MHPIHRTARIRDLHSTARSGLAVVVATLVAVVAPLVGAGAAVAATGYTATGSFGAPPSLGCPSPLAGELCSPRRTAVDADTGNVYVVDRVNDRVQVFAPDGESAAFLTEIGGLDDPYGIAIDQATLPISVYVSQTGSGAIVKLSSDGAPVPSFSADAAFVSPVAGAGAGKIGSFASPLAVDPTSGDLLVGDTGKDIVQRYGSDGAFDSDFDGAGSPEGRFTGIEDLAVSLTGQVLVVDAEGSAAAGSPSRVDRYSAAGTHQLSLRSLQAEGDGLLALDSVNGHILVGDVRATFAGNSRLHAIDAATGDLVITIPVAGQELTGLAIDSGASGRLYAVVDDPFCGGGCGPIAIHAYAPATLPTPAIEPVAVISATTASLAGTVNPNGFDTTARFELSTDGGASWSPLADVDPVPGSGSSPVGVEVSTTGLSPNTAYQVRLAAGSPGGGQVYSSVESFTTAAIDAPTVTLNAPVIDGDSAELSGTVDPNGFQTSYRFEYSTDGGNAWAELDPDRDGPEDAGNGDTPVAVTETFERPEPSVTYQVRVVASNEGGETTQGGQSFTPGALAATAITHIVANLQHDSARLTGYTDPQNQPTTYHFEWGAKADLSDAQRLPTGTAGSGASQLPVGQNVTGLDPETTYYYRLITQNATGTATGDIERFTTRPGPPPVGSGIGANGDRVIELVSEQEKNGNRVGTTQRFTVDGERMLYSIWGGTPSTTIGDALNTLLRAERTSSGWVSKSALPPRAQVPYPKMKGAAVSRDLSSIMVQGMQEPILIGVPSGPEQYFDFRIGGTTAQPGYVWHLPEELSFGPVLLADDLSHAYGWGDYQLPGDPPGHAEVGGGQLYDHGRGRADTVGLLPGDVLPDCGVALPEVNRLAARSRMRASSTDGTRLYFRAVSSGDCNAGGELYLRQAAPDGRMGAGTGATTSLVSGPAVGRARGATFVKAVADGSRAFYLTDTRVTSNDTNETGDLYRFTVGLGNECLTCVVENADVIYAGASEPQAIVADDGSRAYFSSKRVLAPGGVAGQPNLYVWRDGTPGEVAFIAEADVFGLESTGKDLAVASDDGAVLAFTLGNDLRATPKLDRLTDADSAGTRQYYLYDDRARSLACVSCKAGTSTIGVSQWITSPPEKPISADGRAFVFLTTEALSAADTNGTPDVYEWRDGRLGLLTDGRVAQPVRNRVVGVTPDGDDVFFAGNDLVPGTDGAGQLYDARVGGGFPALTRPIPKCLGDSCQGAGTPAPEQPKPGSVELHGPGDPVPGARPSFGFTRLSAGQRAALVRGGRVGLRVRVNRAGKVSVTMSARIGRRSSTIARASKQVRGSGTVSVPLQLSRAARSRLARGSLRAVLSVHFSGVGDPSTQTLTFTRKGR